MSRQAITAAAGFAAVLAEEGWELETTYVTDIIQPNYTVSNGEYDVNFFQNLTYLRQFNSDHDLDLEPIFFMFEQPSGIYSSQYDSLEELPQGASVALPVDTVYDDVDAVFGFARLLAEIDVQPQEALIIEDQEEALPFAMTIAAQPDFRQEEPEKYEALKAAYHSEEVRDWYGEYLDGLLTPAFERDVDSAWKEAHNQ